VQSTPCAGLTPVVVPGCALVLSRECRSDPVTWSLLQASHAARIRRLRLSWPGCVLRPLRGLQDGSEALIHLQCCHAPCEISRRNVRLRTAPLSGDGVAATNVSASRWTELPSGGPVRRLCRWPADEPCLLREARCGRCAERRPAGQGSFGKPDPCGRAATAPATPKAERHPSGSQSAIQLRYGGCRAWARVQHPIRSPGCRQRPTAREGNAGRVTSACSYAASSPCRLILPDPSLAYGVLRKPMSTARSCVGERAHPV